MPDIDRQPMPLVSAYHGALQHWYDEDVNRRETFGNVSIRYYVPKYVKRPTRWRIGAIITDTKGDSWRGCVTVFRGRHSAYLRNENDSVSLRMRGLATQAEAIDVLRWAIQRIYP